MWINFTSCKQEDLVSKAGKPYTAYALRGVKKGWQGAPDEEWMKPLFENTEVTVKERGVLRPGQSAVGFFQNACKDGDLVELKYDRTQMPPALVQVENKTNFKPEYAPLTDDQLAGALAAQGGAVVDTPAPQFNQAPVTQVTSSQPNAGYQQYAPVAQQAPAPQQHMQQNAIPMANNSNAAPFDM